MSISLIYAPGFKKKGGSLPHNIFVLHYHVAKGMQKLFLIETLRKKEAFTCHAVTLVTILRRLPPQLVKIEGGHRFPAISVQVYSQYTVHLHRAG